jgi:UDP-N-acetylglucosamine 4,6-dehydratase
MEKLFQAAPEGRTTYTLVRYGNVVASNGSVIPHWRAQAARGQALSITDRRCTRFWMAPSDAVELIKQAYVIVDRAIVVPKMAALSLVELAGIVAPGADTTETGLRSCEKIHEDLIHADELASDKGAGFVLHARGTLGYQYTSDTAPRLTREQFLAMLQEAESYE